MMNIHIALPSLLSLHAPLPHQTSLCKTFKDKIMKNWWQLSSQVWALGGRKALCGCTGDMPVKPDLLPGFPATSLTVYSQSSSLVLDGV